MSADEIFLEDDAPAPVKADEGNIPPKKATPRKPKSAHDETVAAMAAKKVRIILSENEEIPAVGLFLGVNGTGYLMKPGIPVDVGVELLEVLNHAVKSTPVVDPETRQISGWRDQLRYPYQVIPT